MPRHADYIYKLLKKAYLLCHSCVLLLAYREFGQGKYKGEEVTWLSGNRILLVADFEFTVHDVGPGKPRAFFPEVIEAGAVKLLPPVYTEIPVIQTFVKPHYFPKIKQECTNITMIQQKDVDGGIGFAELLARMAEAYVPGSTWLACWGDSDQKVLTQACQRYKIPCPFDWSDYLDLALEYKLFHRRERSIGLQQAVVETGVERYGMSHLAMDDAVNAARVMVHMLGAGWEPGKR